MNLLNKSLRKIVARETYCLYIPTSSHHRNNRHVLFTDSYVMDR